MECGPAVASQATGLSRLPYGEVTRAPGHCAASAPLSAGDPKRHRAGARHRSPGNRALPPVL